jgi:hypothetical protein
MSSPAGRPARRRALALLALLGLCLAFAPLLARSQDAGLDLVQYGALVREGLAAARRGDRIGLEDAAGRLIVVREVRVDSGAVAVDNAWLQAELGRNPPDMGRIAERLGALADALAQPPGSAPADALDRLAALLSQPPFARPEAGDSGRWLGDLLDWIVRFLEVVLRPTGRVSGNGTIITWAIGILGIALIAGVVLYLARGLRRSIVRETQPGLDGSDPGLTARQALDQAGDLARDGDYRSAVRLLFLAALLRLDERHLLRYDRALTNREYLERVRDQPELRAALGPIVDIFDRVWYGHDQLDDVTFEEYRARVEQIGR